MPDLESFQQRGRVAREAESLCGFHQQRELDLGSAVGEPANVLDAVAIEGALYVFGRQFGDGHLKPRSQRPNLFPVVREVLKRRAEHPSGLCA